MDWKTVIAQAQVKHGLTQLKLAQMIGCSQACINDLVRGRTHEPPLAIAGMCADAGSADANALAHCVASESHGHFEPATSSNRETPHGVAAGLAVHVLEAGQLTSAVLSAIADGVISDNELRAIERESADLVLSLQSVVRACRASHHATKPAPWRAG